MNLVTFFCHHLDKGEELGLYAPASEHLKIEFSYKKPPLKKNKLFIQWWFSIDADKLLRQNDILAWKTNHLQKKQHYQLRLILAQNRIELKASECIEH